MPSVSLFWPQRLSNSSSSSGTSDNLVGRLNLPLGANRTVGPFVHCPMHMLRSNFTAICRSLIPASRASATSSDPLAAHDGWSPLKRLFTHISTVVGAFSAGVASEFSPVIDVRLLRPEFVGRQLPVLAPHQSGDKQASRA